MIQKIPAGRYFVGDPCYCFSNEPNHGTWEEILEDLGYFERYSDKWPGLIASSTTYGDGTYFDLDMNRYSVDAGIIGVTHERYWETSESFLSGLGRIVTFDEDFTFYSNSGIFHIGENIYINTNPSGNE